MKSRILTACGIMLAGLLAFPPLLSADDSGLHVMDAWVRDAPPAMKMTAGYMTVMNHGKTDRALVGVDSPDYARVEMHATQITDGIATMSEVKQIALPAGGDVSFKPGAMHLMLIGRTPESAGKTEISMRLNFSDGTSLDVVAPVRKTAGAPTHMHNRKPAGS